jgi:sugar lactone lactonase YvrE
MSRRIETPIRHRRVIGWWAAAGAIALSAGCSDDADTSEPGSASGGPVSEVSMVSDSGFQQPGDAVASPDGTTFYFTALTEGADPMPAVFSVAASGGSAAPLHSGAPLAMPTGLVMSCDGATLYLADMQTNLGDGIDEEAAELLATPDMGALYTVSTADGSIAALQADGIAVPTGMALSADCSTLYVTGWTDTGAPALFSLSVDGGSADVVYEGAPLASPTGVHVDRDGIAWVMDHLASGGDGPGALFAIDGAGGIEAVVSDLGLGWPGGVSLDSSGNDAVIPNVDADGNARLTMVNLASGERTDLDTPELADPSGLRSARDAAVFVLVDGESGAIFRAE